MRKIKSIEEAIENFKIAAVDNQECSYNGNYKKANKAYYDLKKIEGYLLDHQAIDLLKLLYSDDNLWVRHAAAVIMAPYDTENAYKVIETIRDLDVDMYSFSAERAIINWANLSNPNRDLTSK